jgi:flagellin
MAQFSTSALESLHQLNRIQSSLGVTTRRLATGQQIPQAGLDPASLAIAKGLQAELASQTQASRNVNDGISLLQTAEGGLSNIQNQLGRLEELTVQAASGTLSGTQRAALNEESNAILQEINRVAGSIEFNGQALLNGALANGVQVQVGTGATASDTVAIQIPDSRAAALGISSTDNLSTAASSQAFLGQVQAARDAVSARRASVGATQNRLSSAGSNLGASQVATAAAHSRIADADVAVEAAVQTKLQILQRSSLSILAQTANASKTSLDLIR